MAKASHVMENEDQNRLNEDKTQEKIWVKGAQHGDLDAFNPLVLKYQNRIVALIFSILQDFAQAEDIAQEVFVKAFRNLPHFRNESLFSTWLYQIAMNQTRSFLRWKKIRSWIPLTKHSDEGEDFEMDISDPAPSSLENLISDERKKALKEAVQDLEPEFRTVIALRDIQGLSYEETAEVLNLNTGTVKSRLFRARAALRKILEGRGWS